MRLPVARRRPITGEHREGLPLQHIELEKKCIAFLLNQRRPLESAEIAVSAIGMCECISCGQAAGHSIRVGHKNHSRSDLTVRANGLRNAVGGPRGRRAVAATRAKPFLSLGPDREWQVELTGVVMWEHAWADGNGRMSLTVVACRNLSS